jgi:hypothetical protein
VSIDYEMSRRYRRLLGLGPGATLDDLRRRYRRAMRSAHPDLVGGDGERARELNVARDYLAAELESGAPPRPRPAPSPVVHQTVATPHWTPPAPVGQGSDGNPGRRSRPPQTSGSTGLSCVAGAFLLWVVLLVVGIVGYSVTTLLPLAQGILAP